ncbi:DUF4175 family protein [Sandarakinorhabdus sp.]|uniref:DUF4175 family protein n=1 Tax=Sandarakinorhabdus sp. TaxID=1916663 RepID=UPI003340536D
MTAAVPATAFVAHWSRPARLRSAANDLAIGLPLPLAAAALVARAGGWPTAFAVVVAGLALVAMVAHARSRRFDKVWLVRQLDAAHPELEDSSDLLVSDANLGPLQRLQRQRIAARLAAIDAATLRPGWQTRPIAAAWLIGLAIAAAALSWPAAGGSAPLRPRPVTARPAGPPRLIGQRLRITPPAYTGLPARDAALTTRAPTGSRLAFALRFAPNPTSAVLQGVDGRRLPLTRSGDLWVASDTLNRSLLYRVVAAGAAPGALQRIDAVPDVPPTIRVIEPERTLTPMAVGQTRWQLRFDVSDDHGVAATARLRLIVTSGEGENISFRETSRVITGSGDRKRRRFDTSLDIRSLGLTAGNDIVAQLIVADNRMFGRSPNPQTSRSPSLILRWPPDLGQEAGGLDGMVKTVLPAYFRSQRQIIIDTQALIKQRRRLAPDRFLAQSDTIGVDQRTLRLRYGALLGDESSAAPVLPTSDAPAEKPRDDALPKQDRLPSGHAADDGHDHGSAKPVFGSADDVLADYGHAHAESDAATLMDPASNSLLRQAVDAMWQSELNLRQGAPEKALPFALIALARIKAVQQATRIYLSRTGPELPPIDLNRRLSGKRTDIIAPALAPAPRASDGVNAVPAAAWRALAGPGPVALGGVQAWAAAHPPADPLALAAAIDAVQRDQGCTACRKALRAQLWAAMAPPPAQVLRRAASDMAGKRYLAALQ